jgi:hypothetical protein
MTPILKLETLIFNSGSVLKCKKNHTNTFKTPDNLEFFYAFNLAMNRFICTQPKHDFSFKIK